MSASLKFFARRKFFYKVYMTLLFENANTNSLDKKWYATNVLPICTPLQVLPSNQTIHIRNPHTYL